MRTTDNSTPGSGPGYVGRASAGPLFSPAALIFTVSLALAGCADLMPAKDGSTSPAAVEKAAPAADRAPAGGAKQAPAASDQAVAGTSSEDNLYKLLVAEIAGRRGRMDLSLENYLEVARSTRDPAVAERAVRIAVFSRNQEGGLEAGKLWTEIAHDSTDARQVYAAKQPRAGEIALSEQPRGAAGYAAAEPRFLPEFRYYRPRAGHPDWPRLQAEALEIAQRVRPSLEPPQTGWREQRRRLRSYATAARNFAVNRRRARAGREDLLPLYFIWTLLRTCNFHCDYCDECTNRSRYSGIPARFFYAPFFRFYGSAFHNTFSFQQRHP